ncbi:hypothetical protein H6F67_07260 [Microcoleus sp. FACHB-1515]|uniref:hypothetical protein n=1 Tax=Cyanophyceae TaxID=3028117 RepID=UPI001689157F|nr:hypothetical protein [Microcoleus sp. FACHB-1515]MBD2089650.1 hypothetical protein [Microcoleus sp. FACHB-1515]
MEINTIGFLKIERFEKGAATRGAILVTATDTKPLEFRITEPIRPQSFQAILYGELLDEYVAVELIGLPLLNVLESKPDLVLVCDDLLLGISSKQQVPVVRIARAGETLGKKEAEIQQLISPNSNYPSAQLYIPEKYTENRKTIAEQLQVIFSLKNLVEPFERLEKACTDVHRTERR